MSKLAARHALMAKGYAFIWNSIHGGRARCHCGALSPYLDSDADRRRWHRQHKAEALEVDHG